MWEPFSKILQCDWRFASHFLSGALFCCQEYLTRATPRQGTCGTYLNFELLVGTVGTSVSWSPIRWIRWIRWICWICWIWGWRIFHATVAKFGDPCRKSIPCAILIDTFDTGSRPPSSICQVRVVGGRYGQIDCKGEMIEDASACDHYDHGFYHILPLNSRWVSLSIE